MISRHGPKRRQWSSIVFAALLAWPAVAMGDTRDAPTSDDSPQPPRAEPVSVGVAGQVRAKTGTPLRGVVVLVRPLDTPTRPIPDIANTTDADGRYRWNLPPGRYELTFVRDGTPIAKREVVVPADRRAAPLDVVVPRE